MDNQLEVNQYLQIDDESLINQMNCPICFSVHRTPVACSPCGHMFCRDCIGGWMQDHDICPYCRQESTVRSLTLFEKMAFNSIKYRCKYADRGCDRIGNALEIQEHQKICRNCDRCGQWAIDGHTPDQCIEYLINSNNNLTQQFRAMAIRIHFLNNDRERLTREIEALEGGMDKVYDSENEDDPDFDPNE